MIAICSPPVGASFCIRRTTTAFSPLSKRLHDERAGIMKRDELTASWQGAARPNAVVEETDVYIAPDTEEATTLSGLASSRRRFLESVRVTPVDDALPVMLLSEG